MVEFIYRVGLSIRKNSASLAVKKIPVKETKKYYKKLSNMGSARDTINKSYIGKIDSLTTNSVDDSDYNHISFFAYVVKPDDILSMAERIREHGKNCIRKLTENVLALDDSHSNIRIDLTPE